MVTITNRKNTPMMTPASSEAGVKTQNELAVENE
jgi:hypothetical protein